MSVVAGLMSEEARVRFGLLVVVVMVVSRSGLRLVLGSRLESPVLLGTEAALTPSFKSDLSFTAVSVTVAAARAMRLSSFEPFECTSSFDPFKSGFPTT